MARIFICYTKSDGNLVGPYTNELIRRGHTVTTSDFLDAVGGDWQNELLAARSKVDGFVFFITENGRNSVNLMAELGFARSFFDAPTDKKFLIILKDKTELPDLANGLSFIDIDSDSLQYHVGVIERTIADFEKSKLAYAETSNPPLSSSVQEPPPVSTPDPKSSNYAMLILFNSGSFLPDQLLSYNRNIDYSTIDWNSILNGISMETSKVLACLPFEPYTSDYEYYLPVALTRLGANWVVDKVFIPSMDSNEVEEAFPILKGVSLSSGPPQLFNITEYDYNKIARTGFPLNRFGKSSLSEINTDSAAIDIADALDFASDVNALASVIAYKEVKAPLAIGLFGNWGSGKSFFMNKLQKMVKDLADSKNPLFCLNVVQINFNSWHYSDSNLWASLITKIFDELEKNGKNDQPRLGKLFENLNSTQELLKETKSQQVMVTQEIESLKTRQVSLESEIQQKVKDLNALDAKDIAEVVIKDPLVSQQLKNIQEQYGFLHIEGYKEIVEKTDTLQQSGSRVWESLKLIYSFRAGNRKAALAIFFLVLAAVYFALNFLPGFEKKLALVFAPLAALLSQLVRYLKPALEKVNQAYGYLASLKKTVDAKETEQKAQYNADREALKTQIEGAQASQNELRLQAEQLESKKNQLQLEINDIVSGKKIVRFIESRVTDQRYINSLGIISWIRKDFEELDFLLKQQYDAKRLEELNRQKVEGVFEIDRIILYIDDLDRCDVSIVVRVLEAIHLLLAFPLFVVVVGVDPRWMHNALTQRYKTFLTAPDKDLPAVAGPEVVLDLGTPATSFDYLEKIFQIPFILKPIDEAGKSKLIEDQFPKKTQTAGGSGTSTGMPGKGSGQTTTGEQAGSVNPDAGTAADAGKARENTVGPTAGSPGVIINTDLLDITKEEIEYMQAIGFLIGNSPRTVKRYVNIYRIIRTHAKFEFTGDDPQTDYAVAMILLGFITGLPSLSESIFDEMLRAPEEHELGYFLEERIKGMTEGRDILVRLSDMLRVEEEYIWIHGLQLKKAVRNLGLIRRFSFRSLKH